MPDRILACDLDWTVFEHPAGTLARLMPSQASAFGGLLWGAMKRMGLDGTAMRSAVVNPLARSALVLAQVLGYRIHLITARDDTPRVRAITEHTLRVPVPVTYDRLELRPPGMDPVRHKAQSYGIATLVLDDDLELLVQVRAALWAAGQKSVPPMVVISNPDCWQLVPDILRVCMRTGG